MSENGRFWRSTRFGLASVAFLGFANLYALRVNMSIAMVCMVTDAHHNRTDNSSTSEFSWTKQDQGLILGSFFVGYMVTQIPGGVLAERFGGKNIFLWPMLVAAVGTLLCPLAANLHFAFLVALRVVIGLCEGVVFPAMHSIWSHWAPPLERSKLTGISYAGCQIGNVITMPVAGLLCARVGWQSIFYVFGAFGVVWCMLWYVYASNTPDESKRISAEERQYINLCLVGQIKHEDQDNSKPWLKFATSASVWAIIVAHTTANFGTYLVLTSLPTFMSEVLEFDIKSNGFFSALPYIAFWIGITFATFLADLLIQNRILNRTHVRKLMMLIALVGQATGFLATGYREGAKEQMLAVGFLSLAQALSGFQYGGFVVNHLDIAPRYAGTLFGISNTFATVSGIVAPLVATSLTPQRTTEQWRLVFIVAACVLCFGALFYLLFGSGKLQNWAAVPTEPVYRVTDTDDDVQVTEQHQNLKQEQKLSDSNGEQSAKLLD